MIVLETPRGWRCVTQPDHATLSAEILSLWRDPQLERHPRRDELLLAVREHDNGWQEADAAPRLDRDHRRPHDFTSLPDSDRLEVWRRGIDRYRADQPYVAALILQHAIHLHEQRPSTTDAWRDFIAGLDAERGGLLDEAFVEPAELETDYRWLHLADLASLAFCAGWSKPFRRWHLAGRLVDSTLHLEPFPLTGTTAFSVPCRYLETATFASDAELATALATCRWERAELRIAP